MASGISTRPNRSYVRAWFALVGLSLRRQARARMMIWVALGLLAIAVALVGVQSWQNGWSVAASRFRYPPPTSTNANPFFKGNFEIREKVAIEPPIIGGKIPIKDRVIFQSPPVRVTYGEIGEQLFEMQGMLPFATPTQAVMAAAAGSYQAALQRSGVVRFTRAIMFLLFLEFLLPVWCLSFATEALGGELESRSLVWLLTRPLPRWSIYLAKYVAVLPWALGFTVGGFWLICRAAGPPGGEAFGLYWAAIAGGTFAFTSLFHLFSAATRRPTVVGLVYCFFLEAILGSMPGLMKRISVSYYVRCVIFEAAAGYGIQPDKPSVYIPVSGTTAWAVLIGITATSLTLGAWFFTRSEYRDDAA
jgi:ABC-2 type transport system permease protein